MRVVVLGSNGMMGSMLSFYCKKNNIDHICISRNEFDVLRDTIDKLNAYLDLSNNYTFINCIGCIPQKQYSDTDYKTINEMFPHYLADYCESRGYGLVHLSTDCVYSGKHDYRNESHLPDSTTVYGKSKYLGEPKYGTVVRCSILGPEKMTAFGLFSWFDKNTNLSVNGFLDHIWNGLTTYELSEYIIKNILEETFKNGLIHLFSKNSLSKYQILCEIQKRNNKEIDIIPYHTEPKYYLLSSLYTQPRKMIEEQLDDLFSIMSEFNK
jgi:dTDP-4-dehydrorhamnose reductase